MGVKAEPDLAEIHKVVERLRRLAARVRERLRESSDKVAILDQVARPPAPKQPPDRDAGGQSQPQPEPPRAR